MAGELAVAIAGQEATVLFLNDQIVLRVSDFRSALAIVNRAMPNPEPIGKLLLFSQIGLKAQVGQRRSFELFPQPSVIVRLLSPLIRKMVRAVKI